MSKLTIILILTIFCFHVSPGQSYFDRMGKVTQENIDMKNCILDPTADAVVIADMGISGFSRSDNGFDVVYQRKTRIKILKEAGMKYAEISIPFYQEGDIYEKVKIITATTYTPLETGGIKITQVDTKSQYTVKESKNWNLLKFAMPDVKPGSVIEYEYSVNSQYIFNLRDWEFQWEVPVLFSQYEVRMVPFYQYTWLLQGRNKFDEFENFEDRAAVQKSDFGTTYYDMVSRFVLKNIPAFNDEEFIPSKEDYIIKVKFQLSSVLYADGRKTEIMTTWPKLVNDYLKHEDIGKYLKKSGTYSSKLLNPDSLAGKTPMQKFDYIVNFTKNNYKWDSELSQYSNKSVQGFHKDKSGNSAAINLWLVGALQEAGLESYPVALSTRKHGRILSDYPFSDAFNNMVVLANVDGKYILTDATDEFCPNYRLPIRCMNDKGLVIDEDNMKWVSLQSPVTSTAITSIKIDSIMNDFSASVVETTTEYEALALRNKYGDDKAAIYNDLNKTYRVVDSSLFIKNATDRTRNLTYAYNVKDKPEIINNKIYIRPFLSEIYQENPLKQKTRTYPVNITYPVRRNYVSEVMIPEGYIVQFLPEKSVLNDELFDFDYSTRQDNSRINIVFSYTFKKTVYQPEEYARVKAMFDRIVKKGNEKIVLIRK